MLPSSNWWFRIVYLIINHCCIHVKHSNDEIKIIFACLFVILVGKNFHIYGISIMNAIYFDCIRKGRMFVTPLSSFRCNLGRMFITEIFQDNYSKILNFFLIKSFPQILNGVTLMLCFLGMNLTVSRVFKHIVLWKSMLIVGYSNGIVHFEMVERSKRMNHFNK